MVKENPVKHEILMETVYVDDQGRKLTYPDQSSKATHRSKQQTKLIAETGQKKKKHNWAFFLASLFIGLGITATTEGPMGLFGGLGIGFLFFVDPIYDRVMRIVSGKAGYDQVE